MVVSTPFVSDLGFAAYWAFW